MDDELNNLESELHGLQPVPVSRALSERVGAALVATPARGVNATVHWFWAAVLPAAAAVVAIMLQLIPAQRGDPRSSSAFVAGEVQLKPFAAENVLVSARDEGLVTLDDGTTARRERLRFVDTIVWKNSRTNASLTWTVPREEVRVVPVIFQ
jgi:hypothetical protein